MLESHFSGLLSAKPTASFLPKKALVGGGGWFDENKVIVFGPTLGFEFGI